jgi:hypothetical protein
MLLIHTFANLDLDIENLELWKNLAAFYGNGDALFPVKTLLFQHNQRDCGFLRSWGLVCLFETDADRE